MNGVLRLLQPIIRRVRLMIGRAIVRLVDDTTTLQTLQVSLLAGEVRSGVERFQHYGFTAHPHPGAEAIAAAVAGNRDHLVVLAVDDRRYRKRGLAAGEVALYTDEGDYLLFKRGRIVQVVAGARLEVTAPEVQVSASVKVSLATPLVEMSQNVTIGGTLEVTGAVTLQASADVAGVATVGGLASTGLAAASSIAGNLTITGGNVTADGIGLKTHVHSDPQGGTTGVPQ